MKTDSEKIPRPPLAEYHRRRVGCTSVVSPKSAQGSYLYLVQGVVIFKVLTYHHGVTSLVP